MKATKMTRRRQNNNKRRRNMGGASIIPTTPSETRLRLRLGFEFVQTLAGVTGYATELSPSLLPSTQWTAFGNAWTNWRLITAKVNLRSATAFAPGTQSSSKPIAFALINESLNSSFPAPSNLGQMMEYAGVKTVAQTTLSGEVRTLSYRANASIPNDRMWTPTSAINSAWSNPWILYFNANAGGSDVLVYGFLDLEFRGLQIV
jgi:hypothetical protein